MSLMIYFVGTVYFSKPAGGRYILNRSLSSLIIVVVIFIAIVFVLLNFIINSISTGSYQC